MRVSPFRISYPWVTLCTYEIVAFAGLFFVVVLETNYSAGLIAPLGQVSAQEPQSRQAPASMT